MPPAESVLTLDEVRRIRNILPELEAQVEAYKRRAWLLSTIRVWTLWILGAIAAMAAFQDQLRAILSGIGGLFRG